MVRPRYQDVAPDKASGATYTPPALAAYLAERVADAAAPLLASDALTLLDPATGDGVLLESLLRALAPRTRARLVVHAFDTDAAALARAHRRLAAASPRADLHLHRADFLASAAVPRCDLVVANPPWVRTQVLGAGASQALARRFGLRGRVDLAHAFLVRLIDALTEDGVLGVVLSNRFMTTKAGAVVRRALRERLHLHRVWDLGDTRLFDAAVLPALLVASARAPGDPAPAAFTTAYATPEPALTEVASVVDVLDRDGRFRVPDGRVIAVAQGTLGVADERDAVFRLASPGVDRWLAAVRAHTWGTFASIGKVRVGVKSTADAVFIRDDWHAMPDHERPALLRPLITHHVAGRFRGRAPDRQILYPHVVEAGVRRAAPLDAYPRDAAYLQRHREALSARSYVRDAGRAWYELWVPHDPAAWQGLKLVFRDIAVRPTFFLDDAGAVVNGDCYWLAPATPERRPLLWLAVAVACSRFIEDLYDRAFNNKLYAGRRRFMTQYVARFPLPDPDAPTSRALVERAKARFASTDAAACTRLEREIDALVPRAFGV